MYQRYAIFHTPAPGTPLARFGARWLGWDSARGVAPDHPDIPGLDVPAITQAPRKYGFHGTLKPPFRLAAGQNEEALSDALHGVSATAAPVVLDGLHLARLGRFLALVPTGDAAALGALAARVVQELDPFRAPATDAELARRRAGNLNARQDELLARWGYPHVLDQFRFHLTLTGRLPAPVAAAAETALEAHLQALDNAPFAIRDLTLMGEDGAGLFHQIERFALGE